MSYNFFDSRNPRATNLIKLGDYIGRSLRENVQLFSIEDDEVIYLTENNTVIKGRIDTSVGIGLTDIVVESADLFTSNDKFEGALVNKTKNLINDIRDNDFSSAETSFDTLLRMWETRVKFSSVSTKLEEKCALTNQANKIIETDQFLKLYEIKDELVDFLKENKENILDIPEITNAVKLSDTVSRAFEMPMITLEEMVANGSITYRDHYSSTVYEMVCRQELIKQELLESKKNFTNIWATSKTFGNLVACLFSEDNDILEPLAECIHEVPYLAFTTKKQLVDTIISTIGLQEDTSISHKEIKAFSSMIFETKKPVKRALTRILTEKYGINLQNLKEVPSFKNLLNTQTVVFEALSRVSPKASIQRQILAEVGSMLKSKEGVESIDVNDILHDIFEEAGYNELTENQGLMQYLDYNAVADDLGKIGEILRMLKQDVAGAGGMPPQPAMGQEGEMMGGPQAPPGVGEGAPELGQEMSPEEQMEDEEMGGGIPGEESSPAMDPEQAAIEAQSEMETDVGAMEGEIDPNMEEPGMEGEEGMEPGMEGEMEDGEEDIETAPEDVDQEEIMTDIAEIEQLIADLTAELNIDSEDGEEEMIDDGDEEMGEEGEEMGGGEEMGEEEVDETDVDNDGESDLPIKKKKKGNFPPKV